MKDAREGGSVPHVGLPAKSVEHGGYEKRRAWRGPLREI